MTPPAALALSNVAVRFGRVQALSAVSLLLESSAVHGIVGHNGAGKTTLLDVLAGLRAPDTGTVTFHDRPAQRRDVAYLPTELEFYPGITGAECLAVFTAGRRSDQAFDAKQWAAVFEVPLDLLIDHYSTGMRRKLGLLALLALDRPIIVLDEPMNGLDLAANLLLTQLLRRLAAAGRTVVLTSHVLDTLATSCDLVHVLANGRVVATHAGAEIERIRSSLQTPEMDRRHAALDGLVISSPTSKQR